MRAKGKTISKFVAALCLCACFVFPLAACGGKHQSTLKELAFDDPDLTDVTGMELENMTDYNIFYRSPTAVIGDVMPYYENGVYHMFYLNDVGASHPIYRLDTEDFIHYEEKGEAIPAGGDGDADAMAATGSMEKVGDDYYFFYTGHNSNANPKETILCAKSSGNMDNFVKTDYALTAPAGFKKDDFRDPEVQFDGEKFIMYVAAQRESTGSACIIKLHVSRDLETTEYQGIVYEDVTHGFNMLECPDVFQIGDYYYLTYSGQDVKMGGQDSDGNNLNQSMLTGRDGGMYYAVTRDLSRPFTETFDSALDGMVFYAGKTVQADGRTYLAGWVRGKDSNTGYGYDWGGNLAVHELQQNADGSLSVTMPSAFFSYFSNRRPLSIESAESGENDAGYNGIECLYDTGEIHEVSKGYLSFMLKTSVTFTEDTKDFGFLFSVSSNLDAMVQLAFIPKMNKMRVNLYNKSEMAKRYISLEADTPYEITIVGEGSVLAMYINGGVAFTTRIRNVGNRKIGVYGNGGIVNFDNIEMYTPGESGDLERFSYAEGDRYQSAEKKDIRTLTQNGNRLKMDGSRKAYFTYTAKDTNNVELTSSIYASAEVTVNLLVNGGAKDSYTVQAGTVELKKFYRKLLKGETLTLEIVSKGETDLALNLKGVETKNGIGKQSVMRFYETSKSAVFTAPSPATYGYVASIVYFGSGNTLGKTDLIVYRNQEKKSASHLAAESAANLSTVTGGSYLSSGDTLTFAFETQGLSSVGNYAVYVEIYYETNEFSAGVSSVTSILSSKRYALSNVFIPKTEIEIPAERTNNAGVQADFGAQGTGGFLYEYGRAIDELFPMSEFDDNSENVRHTETAATGDLEIKSDFVKHGEGYMAAIEWRAAKTGYIDVFADYRKESDGRVLVQLAHNNTVIQEFIVQDNEVKTIGTSRLKVYEGDSIRLGFLSIAASGNETNYGVFHFGVSDSLAKGIASFKDDFSARQGNNGWYYQMSEYDFGVDRPKDFTLLEYQNAGGGWIPSGGEPSGVEIKKDFIHTTWKNTTLTWLSDLTGYINLNGTYVKTEATKSYGVAIRAVVEKTDGSMQVYFLGLASSETQDEVELKLRLPSNVYMNPGDKLHVILFREFKTGMGYDNPDDDPKNGYYGGRIDLSIMPVGGYTPSMKNLETKISQAQSLVEDALYTLQSRKALQGKLDEAMLFAARDDATREEIIAMTYALQTAIDALEIDKKAGLIAKYDEYKDLTSNGYSQTTWANFTAALSRAKDVIDSASPDDAEIAEAYDGLVAAKDNLLLKGIANFADDMSSVQGSNGWYYQQSDYRWGTGEGPVNFERLQQNGGIWKSATVGCETLELGKNKVNTAEKNVTLTWEADIEGTVGLVGSFVKFAGSGNGVGIRFVIERHSVFEVKLFSGKIVADGDIDRTYTFNLQNLSVRGGDKIHIIFFRETADASDTRYDGRFDMSIVPASGYTVDTSVLNDMIDGAEALVKTQTYTQASLDVLNAAIAHARDFITASPTRESLAAEKEALQAAIDALEIDKKADLRKKYDEYKDLTETDYFSGWQEFAAALANADAMLKNPNAAEEEIGAVYDALVSGYNALILKVDANLIEDFGGGDWKYTAFGYTWEGGERPTEELPLNKNGDAYRGNGNVVIQKTQEKVWINCGGNDYGGVNPTIVYTLPSGAAAANYRITAAYERDGGGESQIDLRIVIYDKEGNMKGSPQYKGSGNCDDTYALAAGDQVYFMYFMKGASDANVYYGAVDVKIVNAAASAA